MQSGMICLREPESFCEGLDTDVWFFVLFLIWIALCWYCEAFEYAIWEVIDSNLFLQMKINFGVCRGRWRERGTTRKREREDYGNNLN